MKKSWFVFLLFVIFIPYSLTGQTLDLSKDLSKVKVENLTDAQIQQLLDQLEKSGMTESQLEQMALVRGMQPAQIRELRSRINEYRMKGSSLEGLERTRGRLRTYSSDSDTLLLRQRGYQRFEEETEKEEPDFFDFLLDEEEVTEIKPEDKIFGMKLFRNEKITFQPALNIPTPIDYQLGYGDELIIDIWGVSEMTYTEILSPDGSIIIPGIGPIYLSGLTVDDAHKKLRKELSKIYAGLSGNNPNIFLTVSIGNIRSIHVNLVGEVFVPGTYTLPSMATAFNALYASGGPTISGSLRNIKLIRNNKAIATIDFYQFLLDGTMEGNIRLQDQDVIFIEPYSDRVEIEGEIKRPGLYEMKKGESLAELLKFSGGFTGKAYKKSITTIRNTDRENQIHDTKEDKFGEFLLQNGDYVKVDSILSRYENRVEITGAVFRPGSYSLEEGMTLVNLLQKAEGLREDAFPNRGVLYRQKEDMSMEVIAFDRSSLTTNESSIILHKEDLVVIPSIFDLREEYTIEIMGEVRKPGKYPFIINSGIEDLIIQAGGLLESASMSNLEIARRVKNPNSMMSTNKIADIFQFQISPGLKISPEASNFKLEPFDMVFIRSSPGYQTQKLINVEGEVNFPGDYSLSEKDERVSTIVLRSGGLTSYAYPQGARLIRKLPEVDERKSEVIQNLAIMAKDTFALEKPRKTETAIGINLQRILENPGSKYDIFVEEGDKLIIPKQLQTVNLQGGVLYSTTVRYDERMRFSNYISRAGGFTENARKSNSYIIYPNGSVDKTKNFLFIKNFPKVEPGSEIYVPLKDERRKLSTAESVGIFSAVASMSLVVVTLINALK